MHEYLAEVAAKLGLDINGVLNLLLRRYLGHLDVEARLYQLIRERASHMPPEAEAWLAEHPGKSLLEYIEEFCKQLLARPTSPTHLASDAPVVNLADPHNDAERVSVPASR
jgi:hypothetical protein